MKPRSYPFFRIFGKVAPEGDPWGDLTFRYFHALNIIGMTRVIPHNLADLEDLKWKAHAHAFTRPIPEDFVNVVIGDFDVLKRFWIVGKRNVAILNKIDGAESKDLQFYDTFICPDEITAINLRGLGYAASCVDPDPVILAAYLERL